jgi:hypothetical protein
MRRSIRPKRATRSTRAVAGPILPATLSDRGLRVFGGPDQTACSFDATSCAAYSGFEVANSNSMHDAVGPSDNSRTPLAMPIPDFRSCFLAGARIKGMGTFEAKTPGDPTDPIDTLRGGDCRAPATHGGAEGARIGRASRLLAATRSALHEPDLGSSESETDYRRGGGELATGITLRIRRVRSLGRANTDWPLLGLLPAFDMT